MHEDFLKGLCFEYFVQKMPLYMYKNALKK